MRDRVIKHLKEKGFYIVETGFLTFRDFCFYPILEELETEGVVIQKKKNFFKKIFSNTKTYIYREVIEGRGRIVSEMDPYGEEDWTS